MNRKMKHFTMLAFLSALAIVFNVAESAAIGPVFLNMRIGIANIASMLGLILLGKKELCIINVIRVVTSSLLQGTILGSTFWISLAGVSTSTLVLLLLWNGKRSVLFVSVCSSIAHSLGQVAAVMFLYRQTGMAAMIPYYILISIVTGSLTGLITAKTITHIRPLRL